MSDKYIIRNCPCYCEELLSHNFNTNISKVADKGVCIGSISNSDYHCQDCTDCVMKQIVELCKEIKLTYGKLDKPLTATQCTALFSRVTLANQILELLDMEVK